MSRKVVGGVLALAVVVAAVWFLFLRGKHPSDVATAPTPAANDPWAPKDHPNAGGHGPGNRGGDEGGGGRGGEMPEWSLDPDIDGVITLEGQAVDADGKPVGGAMVTISTVPPRHVTTEDDGTFSIDKLTGRTYSLSAHNDALVGKLNFHVTAQPEQAVIHMTGGAALDVTVLADDKSPITGAEVTVGELNELSVKTDAKGLAKVAPVEPGYVGIDVTASGYAPNSTFTTVGSVGAKATVSITLHKGYSVAGRVIDESGAPVHGAAITVTAGPFPTFSGAPKDQIVSNEKGEFTIPAVAPGKHTLRAIDGEHSPATSAAFSISDKSVTGIDVTMKVGGLLTGTVVDGAKAPVPYATVRVAGAGSQRWVTTPRQATADSAGKFTLRGLTRGKLQARAESDQAASKLVDIDLDTKAAVTDLQIVVDITGTISGIVVDNAGAPVPEVQVNAFPDVFAGGNTEGLALAGRATATTDGGGAFVLHGLADGNYRIWASRSGGNRMDWGVEGVPAAAGAKDVKIVLPLPGGLKGTIAIDGASEPPSLATVSVGFKAPTPAQAGVFDLNELSPGEWDVTFRGPEFSEYVMRKVKVESGKVTDLGTVTVFRGRHLTGKVVDSKGAPVAGAKVKLGDFQFSAEGADDQEQGWEDMYGMRSAISEQDGAFSIIGVPAKGTQAAAYATTGSSAAVPVPAGKDDPPPITLVLRGYGSVVGVVTRAGQPMPNVGVSQSVKGGGTQMNMSRTDEQGKFTLSKVPEGTVVIQAMQQQMMSMKTTSKTVTVTAGQQASVTVEFPVGTLTLKAAITPVAGATVNFAQIFLGPGGFSATTGQQLMDAFIGGDMYGQQVWTPGAAPTFTELMAGDYTMCTVPITGNMSDPSFLQHLQENMFTLKAYCQPVKLLPAPTEQTFTQQVPGQPLPEDPEQPQH